MFEWRPVVLVGMPGCGKSTLGQALAVRLGWDFVDTDRLIEACDGMSLSNILATRGWEACLHLEGDVGAHLPMDAPCVVSTGGSMIYAQRGMEHLKKYGTVVYVDVPLDVLLHRMGDTAARGVVLSPGQTMQALWTERHAMYMTMAGVVCGAGDEPVAETLHRLMGLLGYSMRTV